VSDVERLGLTFLRAAFKHWGALPLTAVVTLNGPSWIKWMSVICPFCLALCIVHFVFPLFGRGQLLAARTFIFLVKKCNCLFGFGGFFCFCVGLVGLELKTGASAYNWPVLFRPSFF